MKAWRINQSNGKTILSIADIPQPEPGARRGIDSHSCSRRNANRIIVVSHDAQKAEKLEPSPSPDTSFLVSLPPSAKTSINLP